MKYILPGLAIMAVIVTASSPWMTLQDAANIVQERSYQLAESNPDLCAQFIDTSTLKRVPFGFTEQVSYDCTVTDKIFGIAKEKSIVFITFYKGLIGMPDKKVLKRAF